MPNALDKLYDKIISQSSRKPFVRAHRNPFNIKNKGGYTLATADTLVQAKQYAIKISSAYGRKIKVFDRYGKLVFDVNDGMIYA